MRATPCSRTGPSPKQTSAARNRATVPALPTKISFGALGIRPPKPCTVIVRLHGSVGSAATVVSKPSNRSASTMICVSSLHNAPVSRTSPTANAARMSTRLVMLLEPGTVTFAITGPGIGTISMRSGRAISLSLSPSANHREAFGPWQKRPPTARHPWHATRLAISAVHFASH